MALDKEELVEKIADIREDAGEKAANLVERVKPAVSGAAGKVGDAAEAAKPHVEKAFGVAKTGTGKVASKAKPVVEHVADRATPLVEHARPRVEKAASATHDALGKAVDYLELKTGRDLDSDGFIGAVPTAKAEVPVEHVDTELPLAEQTAEADSAAASHVEDVDVESIVDEIVTAATAPEDTAE